MAVAPVSARAGGRLILTGHDADWRCAVTGSECHFIQAAVGYVRNGAPDPSRPILVLDNAGLQMRASIIQAFGGGVVNQMQVVDPRSSQFKSLPLTVSRYSAIVVASDQTCGLDARGFSHGTTTDATNYCDLNRPANGMNPVSCPQMATVLWPPPREACPAEPGNLTDRNDAFLQDSEAIQDRQADVKAFFDSGGGLFLGSGADNGDGHSGDVYYSFVDLPGGDAGSACNGEIFEDCLGFAGGNFALTPEGRAIGFTDGTNGTPNDINCGLQGAGCATHNSFKPPRIGSPLLSAESAQGDRENTLFEDANPPDTFITAGPGTPLATAGPRLPFPAIGSTAASFAFRPSEDTTTLACALDGGALAACSSPTSFSGLTRGVHRFSVVATDAAHNQDATPAQSTWLVAFDADRDGYLDSNPVGAGIDCNDHNAAINPGAAEIAGNRVDENCDQVIAPFIRVTATFPFGWKLGRCRGCIRLTKLAALNVPARAKLRVACSGPGCHFTRKLKRSRRERARVNLLRFFRGRDLRADTLVQLSASVTGEIASVKRLRVVLGARGIPDVTDANLCQSPGRRRPAKHCPSIG